jgi:hypothetical protein
LAENLSADSLSREGSHLPQSAQMPLGLAELGCEKRIDQVFGHSRSHGPAAHADDVHVVVLHPLLSGEVIVNQPGTHTRNLVRADRGTHPATADRDTALYLPSSDRTREWYDEIRIIVTRTGGVRSEIDYLVPCFVKMSNEVFLQSKSTVISSNSNAHITFLI